MTIEPLGDEERRNLALPTDGTWERVKIPGSEIGLSWRRHALEILGRRFRDRLVSGVPVGPVSPRGWPPKPEATIEIFGVQFPYPRLEVHRIFVSVERSKARYFWRWDPIDGEVVGLLGEPESRRLGTALRRGRLLLDEAPHVGRPFGSRLVGRELGSDSYLERLTEALEWRSRNNKGRVTQDQIAGDTGYTDLKEFRSRLLELNIPWAEIKSGRWLAAERARRSRGLARPSRE